jgi:nucleoid DNA-binding protein
MRTRQKVILGGLLAGMGLLLAFAGSVYSQREEKEPLEKKVAAVTKIHPDTVAAVIRGLGPAIFKEISLGNQVVLPGLGTFRVVRIPEHKDLRNGRPVTIAETNYVEFLPAGKLVESVNQEGVIPSGTVPAFEFTPRPNETPSLKTGKTRTPRIRSR